MVPCEHDVELLCGGDQLRDQDLHRVAVVGGGEHGAGVRLADEAEELLPPAGDDQAGELGVSGEDLVLVDRALRVGVKVSVGR